MNARARIQPNRWDRYQMVGDRGGPAPIRRYDEPEIARWNLIQMVGDRPGVIRKSVDVEYEWDQKPHGFSGFGVSDSGGQQWASLTSGAAKASTAPEQDATRRAQAA
jgi:hypothetical protein